MIFTSGDVIDRSISVSLTNGSNVSVEVSSCGSHGRSYGSIAISNDGQSTSNFLAIGWYKLFSVSDFRPHYGTTFGGTEIVVSIVGADDADSSAPSDTDDEIDTIRCRFNATIVDATIIDERSVMCASPPHEAGSVAVSLSLNGVDWIEHVEMYTYLEANEVVKIMPTSGPANGGTLLVVHVPSMSGNVNAVMCSFDGNIIPSTSFSVAKKEVYCTTPRAASFGSAVAVEISTNGFDFTSSRIIFRCFAPP